MANLINVLGGTFTPPAEKRIAPPEDQLRDAMLGAGLEPPDEIYLDGKLHRFRSGTKGKGGHGDKTGWYVCFSDGIPAGRFGDWRLGMETTFRAEIGRQFTPAENMALTRRMSEAKAARDAELAKQREVTADTVELIWSDCTAAHPEHPYLARKGIKSHGARVTGDGRLVVPLFDDSGTLASLQYIDPQGGKMYHPGGATGSKFWMLGTLDEAGTIYIAEGFATAATIHEATNRPCVVAYSASNLVPVTGLLREHHGTIQDLVIVADNDASGVGQKYADQACAKYGSRMVMPPIPGDANDYAQAGNDLKALLLPPVLEDWLVKADDFCQQPAPISWLVKSWLQDQALIMIHGPSGGGKTFVVLDWCLRIAAGMEDWQGHKVRPGNVVYLAGEGHHGLRGRVAAWKHEHQAGPLNMWLSKSGCDLNTPEGYQKVLASLRTLPHRPSVIVVDTLHRFLLGDENSAQDAKTMLDACNALMTEYNCTVILVHHTGVSDEAQHRARGSSAWRGALDIEVSIVPGKDDQPMQIVQRKSKDAEMAAPVYVNLHTVTIPGWVDEDGEAVTSAIIVEAVAPTNQKKDTRFNKQSKSFEKAWWASGAEDSSGMPYVSRSALIEYLMSHEGLSESSAKTYSQAGKPGRLITILMDNNLIDSFGHGWVITDDSWASSLMLSRGKR